MKDLEKAEKMLYDSGFDDILLSNEQGKRMYVSELMAKFANEVSKALLEEAAEKIEKYRKDEFRDEITTNWDNGFDYGCSKSQSAVLSLIYKEDEKN